MTTGERAGGRLNAATTLAIVAALVGANQWGERVYRRWWAANRPLATLLARLDSLKATYRERIAFANDLAAVAGALFGEIAQATATEQASTAHLPEPGLT